MIRTAAQDAFTRDKMMWALMSNQSAYQSAPQVIVAPGPETAGAVFLHRLNLQLPQVPVAANPMVESSLRSFPALASFYSVATPMAVESFLQEHKKLPKLLFSAFPKIKLLWGTQVKPELAVVDDPEGGFPILTVRLNSNAPDAYQTLNRFDEEWWLDHIGDAEGLLNFTLNAK